MKLNLGAGAGEVGTQDWHLEGFSRIDIDLLCKPHILADVQSLEMIRDNCIDEIFASHIYEHLPFDTLALWEWRRILKPGGQITVAIPDFLVGYTLHRGGFWDVSWFNATIYGCTVIGPYPPAYAHRQVLSADMLLDRMKPIFPDAHTVTHTEHRPVYIGEAVVQGHKL